MNDHAVEDADDASSAFQLGGALSARFPGYVRRSADDELLRAVRAGEYCYVLNARQMGKSSLRVQATRALSELGRVCGMVDVSTLDATEEAKWYWGFVRKLASSLKLLSSASFAALWEERRSSSGPETLDAFIDQVVLGDIEGRVVVFIDEIDSTLNVNFSLKMFFAILRDLHERRAIDERYERLTFVILGVAQASELARDATTTPFNIARAVDLEGFRLSEMGPLVDRLPRRLRGEDVVKGVLEWTGGQPFLTHKAFEILSQSANVEQDAKIGRAFVDRVIRDGIIERWEEHDRPEHLRTIRTRVEDLVSNKPTLAGELLELYGNVLNAGPGGLESVRTVVELALRLTGLISLIGGRVHSTNRIYREVFGPAWIEANRKRFRPYNEALKAWQDSKMRDESRLLVGRALKEAQRWASGKSLSEEERAFLGKSDEKVQRRARLQTFGALALIAVLSVSLVAVWKAESVASTRATELAVSEQKARASAADADAARDAATRAKVEAQEEARRAINSALQEKEQRRAAEEARSQAATNLKRANASEQAANLSRQQLVERYTKLTVELASFSIIKDDRDRIQREFEILKTNCQAIDVSTGRKQTPLVQNQPPPPAGE